MMLFLCWQITIAQSVVTLTFSHTGGLQTFTVPPVCAPSMTIEARGAGGGAGGTSGPAGANGGIAFATTTLISGQVFYVNVGGTGSVTAGGFNGGGSGGVSSSSSGGGGGGASDVRIGSNALSNRVIVAGGGGGGGGNSTYAPIAGGGGAGGSFTSAIGAGGAGGGGCASGTAGGESGGSAPSYGSGGGGGGLTSGGGGGGQGSSTGGYGCPGTLGSGGAGGGTSYICGGATGGVNGGGGGGGGFYGGGGGMTGTGGCNGGGGGGSSYANNAILSNISFTPAAQAGHGLVIITYTYNGPALTATTTHTTLCTGTTATLSASGVNTYTWVSLSNNPTITVTPNTLTNYTVQGTNAFNCVSNAVITITANPGTPTISITSSTNQICLGRSASVTATGAFTYTWNNGISNGVTFTPTVTTTYVVTGQNACGTSTAATTITVSPLAVSVLSQPTLICAGYPSTLTAISGVNGFTWQPNGLTGSTVVVSPTVATLYTVTASDGTCTGTATLNLLTNPIPTVSIVSTASNVCAGSAVTMTASGGLTYTWTPGNFTTAVINVNPTGPTLYSVAATNTFNCVSGANAVVVISPSPTMNVTVSDNLICAGGSSTLTASGANTFTWSNNANTPIINVSPAATTIYTVDGTTGNCSGSQTVQVAVFDPTLAITGPTAICAGASAVLMAGPADTYSWSNGFQTAGITVSPASSTGYTVSATTASGNINCPSTATVQLNVNPNPTLSTVATRSFMCIKESNTISVSGATTYSWSNNATTGSIVVSSTVATTLVYTVTGVDANGCSTSTVVNVKVNGCTGVEESEKGDGFVLYPNPNNGKFNIEINTDETLQLINELGQIIRVIELNAANQHKTEIDQLPPGIYFLQGKNVHAKVIVEH